MAEEIWTLDYQMPTEIAKVEAALQPIAEELHITKPLDFDQVIAITADHKFTDDDLRRGLQIVFPRANSIAQRLQEKQAAVGEIPGIGKVKVKVATEFYLEASELRVPADFGQTDIEKSAGF